MSFGRDAMTAGGLRAWMASGSTGVTQNPMSSSRRVIAWELCRATRPIIPARPRAYDGGMPPPDQPSSPAANPAARGLRGHVDMLARAIGERNIWNYHALERA